ncbi:hypothetical protein DEM27_08985 [Metarhizobium album]|uniref:Uncharacterized protein n=1 Tax=Metarhizobium album TaxID=2182425 RepID=A0A2U2DT96_9HYPH|nr:hypothetical protein [Rhizobium album]PWE56512.1 hypothetical protein DEM27_08985 [Rhizobium album]
MTQVVTVSANTAAYAMEALKPAQRVARKQYVQEAVRTFEATANEGVDETDSIPDVIRTASAELSMMNFGDNQPQASVQEAIDAYRRAGG